MKAKRDFWYALEPVAFLTDTQGMTTRQHAVYRITIDLIYIHGGSVNNDPGFIAGWIGDMGTAAVRRTIAELCQMEDKLTIEGDQITQKRAKNLSETRQKQRENHSETSRLGGVSTQSRRRASNEINDLVEPSVDEPKQPAVQANRVEDIKKEKTGTKKTDRGARLSEDWKLTDKDRDFASKLGMSESEITQQGGRFFRYWTSKAGASATKTNWHRTWCNWVDKDHVPLANGKDVTPDQQREAHERLAQAIIDGKDFVYKDIKQDTLQALLEGGFLSQDMATQRGLI